MSTILNVGGLACRQLHRFSYSRALVEYDGGIVFVDCDAQGWHLSGDPASPEERPVLEELLAAQTDTTVITEFK